MELISIINITSGLSGEIWECGAFQGENAILIKKELNRLNNNRNLRIFDTFTGQPFAGEFDHHQQGSMNGTSFDIVNEKFKEQTNIFIHSGIMPFTFSGLENIKLSIVNIDVDNYNSTKDCLEFVYPKMEINGYILLDDYNCPHCPGTRKAVQEFMINKLENLIEGSPAHIIKK